MKLLLLLLLGMVLNMSAVCGNVFYRTNTVSVENSSPPVEKGKKQPHYKKIKKQPPQKNNSPEYGKVLIVIGIVCLSIVLILAICLIALFIGGSLGFLVPIGIVIGVFLYLGLLSLIWGLVAKNRNNDWNKDYQ